MIRPGRVGALVLFVLVTACGSVPPTSAENGHTPSPPAPWTPPVVTSPAKSTATTTSSGRTPAPPTPIPIPEELGLTCTLPVAMMGEMLPNRLNPERGALIDFKTNHLTVVPEGDMRWDTSVNPNLVDSVATPLLRGGGGLTFVRSANRWLPAASTLVSPDGSRYTYAVPVSEPAGPTTPTIIHVVEVATGFDRVVYTSQTPDFPVAFTAEGIYLFHSRWEIPPVGLVLVDPATGHASAISDKGYWGRVGAGAAWGSLQVGDMGAPTLTVDTLDLKTGQTAEWFRVSDPDSVWVMGLDLGGRPIVEIYRPDRSQPIRYAVVTSPGVAEPLFTSTLSANYLVADQPGIWLAGNEGVYLFSGGTLHFAYANSPGNVVEYAAGGCQ